MKIDVRNIITKEVGEIEEGSFSFSSEIEDLDIVEMTDGKYRLICLEEGIVGQFYVRLSAKITCSRCLASFNLVTEVEFNREFSELVKEDFLPVKNFKIDILEPLREELLLSLPIKPLCVESCKGLCSFCGQNLNVKNCCL